VVIVLTNFFGIRGSLLFVDCVHISQNIYMFHIILSSPHVYTKDHHYTRYNESNLYHVDMPLL